MAITRFGRSEMMAGTALANPTGTYNYYLQAMSLADSTGADAGTAANPIYVAAATSPGTNQVVGNVAHDAVDSGNPVKIGGKYNSNGLTAVGGGDRTDIQTDSFGNIRALITTRNQTGADGLSNNLIGYGSGSGNTNDSNLSIVANANYVYNGTSWDRDVKPNANARLLSSAATTNGTSVKASAGNVFRIQGNNTVASKRYLKIYNKASAPTVGTDTPVKTIVLLASASFDFSFPKGFYLGTGIAFAITGAIADADTTAIGSGDIEAFNLEYA